MIEAKEISNCNAHVVAKFNPSSPHTRKGIENNSLLLHCRKMDKAVSIRPSALFGKVLAITCMEMNCPFRKPDLTKPEAPAQSPEDLTSVS